MTESGEGREQQFGFAAYRLPGEDTTKPRWICSITGNVEHCKDRDRGPEAARRRLAKACMACSPAQAKTTHTYRAGFLVVGPPRAQ